MNIAERNTEASGRRQRLHIVAESTHIVAERSHFVVVNPKPPLIKGSQTSSLSPSGNQILCSWLIHLLPNLNRLPSSQVRNHKKCESLHHIIHGATQSYCMIR